MKLTKNQREDTVTIEFKDAEFDIVCAALRFAASDTAAGAHANDLYYGHDRGEMVALSNAIEEANSRTL